MIQIKNPLKKQPQSKKIVKEKPKEKPLSELTAFTSLSGLMKLRIGIGTIFLFMTIAFALAITSEFAISVALIILAYLALLVVLVKLFLVKHI